MKEKYLLILCFIFFAPALRGQSYTLEFSSVKLVDSIQQTVPAGKVWKVESVMSKNPRKSFSPYIIKVNGNNIYFGDYIFSGKGWMDVAMIQIYYQEVLSGVCSSTPTLIFECNGFEGKSPFWGRRMSANVQNSTNWHLVHTFQPQIPGNSLYITQCALYMSYWEAGNVQLVVTYRDGSSQTLTIPGYQSAVCQSNYWQYISATPNSSSSSVNYATVPEAEMYYNDTKLPLWLPAGTLLQASDNVKYISVVEFNLVTP